MSGTRFSQVLQRCGEIQWILPVRPLAIESGWVVLQNERYLRSLVVRARSGEAAAYRELLCTCEIWLIKFYERRANPSQVGDLVQEALATLHQSLVNFDLDRPFLPWLTAIARNRWVDMLRAQGRRNEVPLGDLLISDDESDTIMASISIARLIDRIKPEQALVIRLVRIEGQSIAEAAQQSGQSQALVKVNIHRGLRKMAQMVEEDRDAAPHKPVIKH